LFTAYDTYYADYQLYLTAIGCDNIRQKKKPRTMDSFLQEAPDDRQLVRLEQRKNEKMSTVRQLQLYVTASKNKKEADVVFSTILRDKKNHNVTGRANILPGLGPGKIERLIRSGIFTAKSLLDADPLEYGAALVVMIPRWQRIVQSYYDSLQVEVD
jgi:hypothetical protein